MEDFLLFALVGFLAQAVDGALGMAYGVVSSTVLISVGVPPAAASASVHAAEVFTTAASAGSHAWRRNVNWKLFAPLAVGGCIGGALGAFVLTSIDGSMLKPWIAGYLAVMGGVILWRALKGPAPRLFPVRYSGPLGFFGGLFDAIGGGGWGPTVATAMVGAGGDPRTSIGTTNTAEVLVTSTISATFLAAILTGHWADAGNLGDHAMAVAGLVAGGLVSAPLAGLMVSLAPQRILTGAVGVLVTCLAGYRAARLAGWL